MSDLSCIDKTERATKAKQHDGPLEAHFITDMQTHIYAHIQFKYFHIWKMLQGEHNISTQNWSVLACKLCPSYSLKNKQIKQTVSSSQVVSLINTVQR